jgi:dynein heavy chain
MIHWTRQIKEEVTNQENMELSEKAGPLAEIEFWRSRTNNLHGIESQLKRPEVVNIQKVLELTKSTYLQQFTTLSELIQKGYLEAQDNLAQLSLLQGPCEKLATALPQQIPAFLPEILKVIRSIWSTSAHYNSEERISSLLRKVSTSHHSHETEL